MEEAKSEMTKVGGALLVSLQPLCARIDRWKEVQCHHAPAS